MVNFDEIQKRLLMEVADLHKVPEGNEEIGRASCRERV